MTKHYWEDFTAGQVAEYGPQTVTAEDIKAFAAEFDPQPMHLDEEAARQSLVGGLCASGWHSCAIMMRILADGFVLDSSSMGATGCGEIKWLANWIEALIPKTTPFDCRSPGLLRDLCEGLLLTVAYQL